MPVTQLEIVPRTNIKELVAALPVAADVMQAFGLGCSGCSVSAYETIEDGARAHGLRVEPIIAALQLARSSGSVPPIDEADRKPARRAPGGFHRAREDRARHSDHVGQRRRRQVARYRDVRHRLAPPPLPRWDSRRRYHRALDTQALRAARAAGDQRRSEQDDAARSAAAVDYAGDFAQRHRNRQLESAQSRGGHGDGLARSDRRRRHPSVLRASALGRSGLFADRLAARNV